MCVDGLKNRWIVITRPEHQAAALIATLEADGAKVIAFPLLEIVEPADPALLRQQLAGLEYYDLAIFISPNAVERMLSYVDAARFSTLKVAAVGKKTASSLRKEGIAVDYFPQQTFNSEALLVLEGLRQVKGQRIAIFRGEGGRDMLRDTLLARGAQVDYINVYARRCPVDDIEVLKQHHQRGKLDIIVLTSGESLDHLLRLANDEAWFSRVPLLVGSERIKEKFQQRIVGDMAAATDPSDETIYNTLCKLWM